MADFKFNGFPENESFEIPDQSINKNSRNSKAPSFDELKNMTESDLQAVIGSLPPEMTRFMKSVGIDPSTLAQQLGGMISNMDETQFDAMLQAMDESIPGSCNGNCGSCNEESDELGYSLFPTGEVKYLFPDEFGTIECEESENLYDEFVARYGSDSTQYLDDNIGLRDFILNDITGTLDFDNIKNMRFVNSNKYFILFYMEPKDPSEYGFFAAIIKKGNNNFAVYIPTYCNTFGIDEEDMSAYLYNTEDDAFMFEGGDATNIASFKFLAANLIEFAVAYSLAPKKKLLLSPKEFGTIKSIRPSITGDSRFLPIGKITSNGSTKSTLLLKDAELPLDNENYNLFMKFTDVVDETFLKFISQITFQVDFNECPLMDNVELKYTSDGKLYFDIEHLGSF